MKTNTSLFTYAKVLTLCSASLFVACGGSDDDDPEALAPPLAVDGATIDLDCLGTASDDVPYAKSLTVDLTTYELGNAARPAIPGATVTAYSGTDFDTELDSGEADENGAIELNIPAGETRISYKLEADEHLPTFSLNNYYGDDLTDSVPGASLTIANALPSFVQVTRTPGTGVLAGTAVDCQGRPLTNAFAVVSTTSGTKSPVAGSLVFYVNTVPVTTLSATNKSGEFAVLQIPASATTVYIQTWGYLTQADADDDKLTLIGEVATPVLGDSVITAAIDVLRTN